MRPNISTLVPRFERQPPNYNLKPYIFIALIHPPQSVWKITSQIHQVNWFFNQTKLLGISPNKLAPTVPIIQRKGQVLSSFQGKTNWRPRHMYWAKNSSSGTSFCGSSSFFFFSWTKKKRPKNKGTSPNCTKDPENFWKLVLLGCFCLLHKNWICKGAKTMGLITEKYNYHSH